MFSEFVPKQFLNNVYEISAASLREQGIEAMLLDLDNTLNPWHDENIPQKVLDLLRSWETAGMKLCLLSNNSGKRVERMAGILGIRFVKNACKPSKSGYLRACKLLQVAPSHTAMVGDQLLTDIRGANRAGVYPILVKPIAKREMYGTMYFSRNVEKLIYPHVYRALDAAGINYPK